MEAEYAEWLRAGSEEMRAAVDAYGSAPSEGTARGVTRAIHDAFVRHYGRLARRLRTDREFAAATRLYGTELREPALRAATTALEVGREADDAEGVALLSAWVRQRLLSGKVEDEALETVLGGLASAEEGEVPAAGAFRTPSVGKHFLGSIGGPRSGSLATPSWRTAPFSPRRAGSAPPAEPGDVPKPPSSLEGWVRVDDPKAFGGRWREALGWAPEGTPGWDMLGGLYALYIKPSGSTSVTDALGGPVYLASGVWATEAGRSTLAASVEGDVACARLVESAKQRGGGETCRYERQEVDGETTKDVLVCGEASAEIPATCRDSSVMDVYARPICDHYDGRGHVFLAECDCVKQLQLPSVMRLKSLCDSEADLASANDVTRESCARMAGEGDSASASEGESGGRQRSEGADNLAAWPVPNVNALKAPVLSNALMRYAVRSQRRLSGMQGTYAACVYPPCASMLSRDAYTDARVTRMERDRCPPIRCEASINVDWVGGSATVEGNMLRVRCYGGECMLPDGTPKCQNGGRCLQDGKCACEGTGFRGERCELPEDDDAATEGEGAADDDPESGPSPPPPAADIAGPLEPARVTFGVADLLKEPTWIALGLGIAALVVFAGWLLRRMGTRR
jgi:hypothetical protein